MCGIVGYIGEQNALEVILGGLEKLEYRGYDSAGISVFDEGEIQTYRARGKLIELKKELSTLPAGKNPSIGIGHTRWATHGRPSRDNAHPHTAGRVSLIHNGIIENYVTLRAELQSEGCVFSSETDTEIAAHLLNKYLETGLSPFDALKKTCGDIEGSYAFLAIDVENPDRVLIAKNSSPIVVGFGEGEVFIASDIPAILAHTRDVVILEDGDIAEISLTNFKVESNGQPVTREKTRITWDPVTAQKGGYKHFMLKEIHEQSQVVTETFRGRVKIEESKIDLSDFEMSDEDFAKVDRVVLVACGTAWHACLVAKYYLELLSRVPCEVDFASEFRYRKPILDDRTLVLAVSQSGETADTLAAINEAVGVAKTASVCNVLGSSLARKVDCTLFTQAGPEISVASTKAFTTQLVGLYLLAVRIGQAKNIICEEKEKELIDALIHLPAALDGAIKTAEAVEVLAKKFHSAKDFLFIGRGLCYPIALEGALKLKEISYIHAEGYPAGELKHGPIALIDEEMPVVVVLQRADVFYEKTLSNLKEVESRGGRIIAVTDTVADDELKKVADTVIEVPFVSTYMSPIVLTVPLQLLSYYVADFKGTDVDLPRNLAKSVTVE